ncbi:MAG: signal peptidase I [Thermoleophilaceae bacterium]
MRGNLVLACGVALAALMLVPGALGYHRYVVTGGSMGGTYARGSLVYDRAVPVRSLRVGDVITYRPPSGALLVTHRIVWIGRGADRAPAFRTKGDANAHRDPWRFELKRPTQAKVAFSVPLLGWPFAALADRELRMLLIGLPALLVALGALLRTWREVAAA